MLMDVSSAPNTVGLVGIVLTLVNWVELRTRCKRYVAGCSTIKSS